MWAAGRSLSLIHCHILEVVSDKPGSVGAQHCYLGANGQGTKLWLCWDMRLPVACRVGCQTTKKKKVVYCVYTFSLEVLTVLQLLTRKRHQPHFNSTDTLWFWQDTWIDAWEDALQKLPVFMFRSKRVRHAFLCNAEDRQKGVWYKKSKREQRDHCSFWQLHAQSNGS